MRPIASGPDGPPPSDPIRGSIRAAPARPRPGGPPLSSTKRPSGNAGQPPSTRRERRLAERDARRAREARRQSTPAWRSTTGLLTIAAIVVGVVAIGGLILLQSRPSANAGDLIPPTYPLDPAIPADGMTLGSSDAPVTLEVWSDFQCPGCGQFATVTEPQLRTNEITAGTLKLVIHDAAFQGRKSTAAFDESTQSAAAARCAGAQGQYFDYYDWLFANQSGENQGAFELPTLQSIATQIGLDMTAWQSCFDKGDQQQAVIESTNEAATAGVTSTPWLVINGEHWAGGYDYASLQPAIAAAAASASPGTSASPSAGASPSPDASTSPAASPSP